MRMRLVIRKGRLFGKGRSLGAQKYSIILPDNVGHATSKPSDQTAASAIMSGPVLFAKK